VNAASRRKSAGAVLIWAAFCALGGDGFALAARGRVPHPAKNPFSGGRNVDEDSVTDPREWQAIWLIHPTPDGTRIAAYLYRKGIQVEKVIK
jgi:hypothetical protein